MLLSVILLFAAAELHAAVNFAYLTHGVARPLAPPPSRASCELEACPAASAFTSEHIHPHGGGVCTMPSSSLLASFSLDASWEEHGVQVPILASPTPVAPRVLAPGGVAGMALPHIWHPPSQPWLVKDVGAGHALHLPSTSPSVAHAHASSSRASRAPFSSRVLAPGGVAGMALPHMWHPLSQPWLVKDVGAGHALRLPSTSPSVAHAHASSSCASRVPFSSRVRVQSVVAGCASTHHLDSNFIPLVDRVEASGGGSCTSGHLLVSDVDTSMMGALVLPRVSPVLPSSNALVLSPIQFGASLEPGRFDPKGSFSWLAHMDYDLLMHRRRVHFSPLSLARGSFVVSVGRCVTTSSSMLVRWFSSQVLPGLYRYSGELSKMSVWFAVTYANMACAMSAIVAGECFSGFIILISWSTTTMVLFKRSGGVLPSVSWVLPRLDGRSLFWVAIFSRFVVGSCVCLSCAGNDPNCKGDDTCIMAKALKANATW